MTFTSKLRWGKHLKQKITIAKKKILMYKGCLKPNWGPPQRSRRWLYTGILRPRIAFGCLVWGKEITNVIQVAGIKVNKATVRIFQFPHPK